MICRSNFVRLNTLQVLCFQSSLCRYGIPDCLAMTDLNYVYGHVDLWAPSKSCMSPRVLGYLCIPEMPVRTQCKLHNMVLSFGQHMARSLTRPSGQILRFREWEPTADPASESNTWLAAESHKRKRRQTTRAKILP